MSRGATTVASEELALDSRLGHVIKRAEQALIAGKNQRLRRFDLTVPQYAALLVLSTAPSGLTAAQLARKCLVTPQTMATVLGNLEVKDLIAREHSSLHARVMVVELTRQGRALLKKADVEAVGLERRLADAFEPAERDQLRDLLERAIVALQDAGDEARSPVHARRR